TILSNTLVSLGGFWKFDDSGDDLGAMWSQPDYDDSAWAQGPAAFFQEEAPLPAPKNTPLTPGRVTYYFRTTFVFQGELAASQLQLQPLIDDGAVGYLNGVEVFRINMPAGPVTSATLASGSVGHATIGETLLLPLDHLLLGTNLLAIEVHQAPALT